MRKIPFGIVLLLAILLCLAPLSVGALTTEESGSITVSVLDRESQQPVADAQFCLYPVATASVEQGNLTFTYTAAFADNGMALGDLSDAYLPTHLMTYAAANTIPGIRQQADAEGQATFDQLACGAYLVVPTAVAEGYLTPSPFLVTLPLWDESEGSWSYHVTAAPKTEAEKDQPDETTYISVKKQWKTNDDLPKSITVSLLKDGTAVEEISLNRENNWYHKWEGLDKNHAWNVVETAVPDGYAVTYSTTQNTVTITNTHTDYEEPPEPDDELIQTGQLNWPIPILLIAGLLLFSLGWMLLNFGKKDGESV